MPRLALNVLYHIISDELFKSINILVNVANVEKSIYQSVIFKYSTD